MKSDQPRDRKAGEIILTLADQTNEMGAGSLSAQEIPARPKSRTPLKKDKDYKRMRKVLLTLLAPRMNENKNKYTHSDGGTPKFINHEDGKD